MDLPPEDGEVLPSSNKLYFHVCPFGGCLLQQNLACILLDIYFVPVALDVWFTKHNHRHVFSFKIADSFYFCFILII
jgi:hypothetical protein